MNSNFVSLLELSFVAFLAIHWLETFLLISGDQLLVQVILFEIILLTKRSSH